MTTGAPGNASLKLRLFQVVGALSGLHLPYMIIGAFALSAWGRPRATLDLDFMVQTAILPETLLRKLKTLGLRFDEDFDKYNPMIRGFHKRFRAGRTAVDLLLNRDEHDNVAFSRRRKKRLDDRYLWFPSPEDFLLQKLKVGRPQDMVDAASIVERMGGKLDKNYLKRWARQLAVNAELEHLLRS